MCESDAKRLPFAGVHEKLAPSNIWLSPMLTSASGFNHAASIVLSGLRLPSGFTTGFVSTHAARHACVANVARNKRNSIKMRRGDPLSNEET